MARLPRRTTASAPNDIAESGQKGVKTVAACISLCTTHISTHAPAQANRHTHTQTPAQTDPDAFSDTVSSSFSRLSAAMGPSYCVFSESVRFFFASEFILTVVDMHVDVDQILTVVHMHVDVDQHTYTHIDATTSASEIYALSKHALL